MSLCEALHGMAIMTEVGAPWPAMGSSPKRGKRGKEEGEGAQLGCSWGAMGRAAMEELVGCSSARP
jgi:hypothetical protein